MSFIRPEIRMFLSTWFEPLVLAILAVPPILIVIRQGGSIWFTSLMLGVAFVMLLFAYAATRRILLLDKGLGRGYIEVTEHKISFFSEEGGGVLDVEDLTDIDLSTDLRLGHENEHYWILTAGKEDPIVVPGNAHGIENLISILTSIPGIDLTAAIRFRVSGERGVFKVWRRNSDDPLRLKRPLV